MTTASHIKRKNQHNSWYSKRCRQKWRPTDRYDSWNL